MFAGSAGAQDVLIKLQADKKPVQATIKIVPPFGATERDTFKGEKFLRCPIPETMIEIEPGELHYVLPRDMKKRCVGPEVIFVLYLHAISDNVNRDRSAERQERGRRKQVSAPVGN